MNTAPLFFIQLMDRRLSFFFLSTELFCVPLSDKEATILSFFSDFCDFCSKSYLTFPIVHGVSHFTNYLKRKSEGPRTPFLPSTSYYRRSFNSTWSVDSSPLFFPSSLFHTFPSDSQKKVSFLLRIPLPPPSNQGISLKWMINDVFKNSSSLCLRSWYSDEISAAFSFPS